MPCPELLFQRPKVAVFAPGRRLSCRLSDLAHFRYYAEELRNGAFAIGGPTDHVLEVSGQAPEDFESIARRYIQDPSLIHPALRVGSKSEAIGFLFKMMATRPVDLEAWERDRGYPLLRDPILAQDSPDWRATAERRQLNLLPGANTVTPALEASA